MSKIKTKEDVSTTEDGVDLKKIKEVTQPSKQEITKIKLVNRNDYDVFIKYCNQEFCISPRGEVVCNEEDLQQTLPDGVFKLIM